MKTSILLAFFCCPLLYFSQPNTEVFLFDLNTENDTFQLSNFKNISNNIGYDNQPSFLNDSTILYVGTRNNQTDIVKYSISDNSKEWLSNTNGSEYSPIKIPLQNAISAIRLEENGEQKLYRYDLLNEDVDLLVDDVIVGYQLWMRRNILISSTLQGDILNLTLTDFDSKTHTNIDTNVGRSLVKIPFHIPLNVRLSYVPDRFGYIDKKLSPWNIMSYDINNGQKEKIVELLPNVEDFTLIDSKIVIAKGSQLFVFQKGKMLTWKKIANLDTFGITNITRLAVSPDGKKLAVVGELLNPWPEKKETQLIEVLKTQEIITIEGKADEAIWIKATWHPIDQRWLGQPYTTEDFEGQYKLCWSEDALYILVEIKDDVLFDQYEDPLKLWWDDDCVEVFIDENNSGGEHQYNHNAFAYHVALDGNVVDMSTEKTGKLYNSHVESKNITSGNTTVWELKISIFDDTYDDENDAKNKPVKLYPNKKIGFAIAYCDNDSSIERENFIGSIPVEGENKNKGWIDANIFGTIQLKN